MLDRVSPAATAQSLLALAVQAVPSLGGFIAQLDLRGELELLGALDVDDTVLLDIEDVGALCERSLGAEGERHPFLHSRVLGAPLRSGGQDALLLTLPLRLGPEAVSFGVLGLFRAPGSVIDLPRLEPLLQGLGSHAAASLAAAARLAERVHDPISGLLRREELETELRRALEEGCGELSLIMLSLGVSTSPGGASGRPLSAAALPRVARLLRSHLPPGSCALRLEGASFAALVPGSNETQAQELGRKLVESCIRTRSLELSSSEVAVGIALSPQHGERADELLQRVREALWHAARRGVRSPVIWSEEVASRRAQRAPAALGLLTGSPSRDESNRSLLRLLGELAEPGAMLEPLLPDVLDALIERFGAEHGFVLRRQSAGWETYIAHLGRAGADDPVGEPLPALLGEGEESRLIFAADGGERSPALRSEGRALALVLPILGADREWRLVLDARAAREDLGEPEFAIARALAGALGRLLSVERLEQSCKRQMAAVEQYAARVAALEKKRESGELVAWEPEAPVAQLRYNYEEIVGRSPAMRQVFRVLDRVTDSDVPVLIKGETGTGKELIARALHRNGPRRSQEFVTVNCSALSESLMESELFGHEKGSFTGADAEKQGLFELADEGTLFLDEIQDMSPSMQRELLRVLQEGEVRRVGGKRVIKVDVRIVSASNQDLKMLMTEGRFRPDLYYRLNVVALTLPPLRARREDIGSLLQRFLERASKTHGLAVPKLEQEALDKLMAYDWPGNIRELQNLLEKTVLMLEGGLIRAQDLVLDADSLVGDGRVLSLMERQYKEAKEAFLAEYLRSALTRAGGNVTRAAEQAGLLRSSFHKMMRKHGITAKEFSRDGA